MVLKKLQKSVPRSEIMTFLGVLFNARTMTTEDTTDRLREIRQFVDQ